ncbi:MAG: BREX-4 system phosphatase PglZ, partial [Candidatus Poribacteria bacterium]
KLKPRNSYINDAYIDNAFIYWVDALGVEYLGLIQTLLDDKYKGIYYEINIGYAEIPTVTEFNKDFVAGRKYDVTRTLDDLKHKGKYPDCIEEELRLVENAVKAAIQKLDMFDRVIITSDHGASRGAILHKGQAYKSDDIAKVERFGRYCIQADTQYENRYAGCIDKDEYHIFASYDRFSISGNEKSEIHGGATLEEVLVPIIVLSKTSLEQKAIITPISTEIKPKAGELPRVMFKVDKQFEELFAMVGTKRYICRRETDYWYFEPEVSRQERYVAKISSKGNIGEFEYKIVKGRTDNKKFDI